LRSGLLALLVMSSHGHRGYGRSRSGINPDANCL
jgi:hypothetical protein